MAQGKVLHWGLSEMGLKTLRRAHAAVAGHGRPERIFDAVARAGTEVIPLCEELGIGFVPWSPLGVGFLTGAIDAKTRFADGDIRRSSPASRRKPAAQPRARGPAQELGRAEAGHPRADRAGLADGAEALDRSHSWHDPDAAPAREHRRGQIQFTPEELAELNAAAAAIEIQGARLPDAVLAFSGVEAPEKSEPQGHATMTRKTL